MSKFGWGNARIQHARAETPAGEQLRVSRSTYSKGCSHDELERIHRGGRGWIRRRRRSGRLGWPRKQRDGTANCGWCTPMCCPQTPGMGIPNGTLTRMTFDRASGPRPKTAGWARGRAPLQPSGAHDQHQADLRADDRRPARRIGACPVDRCRVRGRRPSLWCSARICCPRGRVHQPGSRRCHPSGPDTAGDRTGDCRSRRVRHQRCRGCFRIPGRFRARRRPRCHSCLGRRHRPGSHKLQNVLVDPARIEQEERALLAERIAGWADKYPDVSVEQTLVEGRGSPTSWTGPSRRSSWLLAVTAVADLPGCCSVQPAIH